MPTAVAWRESTTGHLEPYLPDRPDVAVGWAPQEGAQQAFLERSEREVLLHGNRGSGKTTTLIVDFLQHTGPCDCPGGRHVGKCSMLRGFGSDWAGAIFRPEAVQLGDVIRRSHELIHGQLGIRGAEFNRNRNQWTFPGGETLRFCHAKRIDDYWKYHGNQWQWIGWEELTTWATDEIYRRIATLLRSSNKRVRLKIRATTNPSGPGHGWVKSRFQLSGIQQTTVGQVLCDTDPISGVERPPRVAVFADVRENRALLHGDPTYQQRIVADAVSAAQREAWGAGNWDIVDGAYFADLWVPEIHCVPAIRPDKIPPGWRLDRSYDHGQSHPFSVGWWAESNGEPVEVTYRDFDGKLKTRRIGTVRGDLIRIAEWYGWNGRPNVGLRMSSVNIARGILERQKRWGIHELVARGVADSEIFTDREPGSSPAADMAAEGVEWEGVDKSAGSRVLGWQRIRKYLEAAVPKNGYREHPGLFVCVSLGNPVAGAKVSNVSGAYGNCQQFLRIMPEIPCDPKNPDDVLNDGEDHLPDEVRYRLWHQRRVFEGSWGGLY